MVHEFVVGEMYCLPNDYPSLEKIKKDPRFVPYYIHNSGFDKKYKGSFMPWFEKTMIFFENNEYFTCQRVDNLDRHKVVDVHVRGNRSDEELLLTPQHFVVHKEIDLPDVDFSIFDGVDL